jgi:hypothetical protein
VPDQTPATELRTAATALRDPDADACQHPGCGCPDELHRRDADGASWCKDCYDQHPFRSGPTSDVPERLRSPLADWLEREADGHEAIGDVAQVGAELLTVNLGVEYGVTVSHSTLPQALTVARALVGGPS